LNIDLVKPNHRITLIVRNEGETPEIIKRIRTGLVEGTDCFSSFEKVPDFPITQCSIVGGNERNNNIVDWFEVSEWKHIPEWVYCGCIDYEDIFEESHATRFCWHRDSQASKEGFRFRKCDNREANRRT